MLQISNSLLWRAVSIRRSEINLEEFETITRQSLRAFNKTGTKLSTIFACPLNEPMIIREMTFNFEAFVRPTKADAKLVLRATYNLSNRKTNWTSCRQIRFSGFCRITHICVFWLDIPLSSAVHRIAELCILLIKKEKKRSNHRLCRLVARLSYLHHVYWRNHWWKTCFRL